MYFYSVEYKMLRRYVLITMQFNILAHGLTSLPSGGEIASQVPQL